MQLTQGERISLSRGWESYISFHFFLWVARSVTCRVVLHFKQHNVSVIRQ